MNRIDQEDMEGQEDQEAHFSSFSQRISLWPQGLFSKKEVSSFFWKSKIIRGSLICLAVSSFLVVLIVYPQTLSKVADIQSSIQMFKGVLETALPQAQISSSHWGNASAEIQVLKKSLENANAQTQMTNSNLKNASDEIKRLKKDLENTNNLNSETQKLRSGLEKASGEIQKIMASLVNINDLNTEVQGLKEQLENLTAQQYQQGNPSSLLQLLIQGWYFYEGKAYYISDTEKTWDEAEDFCVSRNSHLASVTSDREQSFLSKKTNGVYHWIGLTDKDTEGNWYWVDGTPYNKSSVFWNKNQPDNWKYGKDLSEDCVHTQEKWNDMLCDKPFPWICKKVPELPGQHL